MPARRALVPAAEATGLTAAAVSATAAWLGEGAFRFPTWRSLITADEPAAPHVFGPSGARGRRRGPGFWERSGQETTAGGQTRACRPDVSHTRCRRHARRQLQDKPRASASLAVARRPCSTGQGELAVLESVAPASSRRSETTRAPGAEIEEEFAICCRRRHVARHRNRS